MKRKHPSTEEGPAPVTKDGTDKVELKKTPSHPYYVQELALYHPVRNCIQLPSPLVHIILEYVPSFFDHLALTNLYTRLTKDKQSVSPWIDQLLRAGYILAAHYLAEISSTKTTFNSCISVHDMTIEEKRLLKKSGLIESDTFHQENLLYSYFKEGVSFDSVDRLARALALNEDLDFLKILSQCRRGWISVIITQLRALYLPSRRASLRVLAQELSGERGFFLPRDPPLPHGSLLADEDIAPLYVGAYNSRCWTAVEFIHCEVNYRLNMATRQLILQLAYKITTADLTADFARLEELLKVKLVPVADSPLPILPVPIEFKTPEALLEAVSLMRFDGEQWIMTARHMIEQHQITIQQLLSHMKPQQDWSHRIFFALLDMGAPPKDLVRFVTKPYDVTQFVCELVAAGLTREDVDELRRAKQPISIRVRLELTLLNLYTLQHLSDIEPPILHEMIDASDQRTVCCVLLRHQDFLLSDHSRWLLGTAFPEAKALFAAWRCRCMVCHCGLALYGRISIHPEIASREAPMDMVSKCGVLECVECTRLLEGVQKMSKAVSIHEVIAKILNNRRLPPMTQKTAGDVV